MNSSMNVPNVAKREMSIYCALGNAHEYLLNVSINLVVEGGTC